MAFNEDSSASGHDEPWIQWFCGLKGHEMFCEVERSYIEDGFNLYGLRACVSNFSDCLDLILDRIGPDDSDDSHLTQSACTLYGLIHARYIITAHGLDAMYNKYAAKEFGTCPLVQCCGQPVLPVGLKDEMGADTVKIFCPKCHQVFHTPPLRSRANNNAGVDGAAFGTTFAHLFLMTFSNLVPDPLPRASTYVPRVFGFRVHQSAQPRTQQQQAQQQAAQAQQQAQQQQRAAQAQQQAAQAAQQLRSAAVAPALAAAALAAAAIPQPAAPAAATTLAAKSAAASFPSPPELASMNGGHKNDVAVAVTASTTVNMSNSNKPVTAVAVGGAPPIASSSSAAGATSTTTQQATTSASINRLPGNSAAANLATSTLPVLQQRIKNENPLAAAAAAAAAPGLAAVAAAAPTGIPPPAAAAAAGSTSSGRKGDPSSGTAAPPNFLMENPLKRRRKNNGNT